MLFKFQEINLVLDLRWHLLYLTALQPPGLQPVAVRLRAGGPPLLPADPGGGVQRGGLLRPQQVHGTPVSAALFASSIEATTSVRNS